MMNHRKSRYFEQVKETDTLEPKGMELGHDGFVYMVTNGHMILGSKMAPKVFGNICGVELGKPNAFPEIVGRNP